MRRTIRRFAPYALTASLLLLAAAATRAGTTGALLVELANAAGDRSAAAPVEAEVVVTSPALPRPLTAMLEGGRARFTGLPPGVYQIALGGSSAGVPAAEAEVQHDRTTVVRLPPAGSVVHEEIAVVAPSRGTPTLSDYVALKEVERIPIARDYRGYPQLVAGVTLVPNGGGLETPLEPSSKAGNNYQDRGAGLGSRDNTYYLDGFDITGMGSGAGDLTFNNEVILEEQVITSGVTADYAGGAGYVANVVTRSGGPTFAGTVNYYRQDSHWADGWDSADTRLHRVRPDQHDYGLTLGGPVVRDSLWFFLGVQRRESGDEVSLTRQATPEPMVTTFRQVRENAFGKLTYQPLPWLITTLSGYYEPRLTSGSRDPNAVPGRYSEVDHETELGSFQAHASPGGRWLGELQVVTSNERSESRPERPEAGPSNTILFAPGITVPAYQRELGSSGGVSATTHRKDQQGISLTRFLDLPGGDHAVEVGYEHRHWQEEVANSRSFGFSLTSLAPGLAGLTTAQARALNLLAPSEYDIVFRTLAADTGSALFAAADADGDGALSAAEFAGLTFASTAGNTAGVNFLRSRDVTLGVNNVRQRVHTLFLQDEWRGGRLTLTAGVRGEEREYFASDDSTILETDPLWMPRLGLAWDAGTRWHQVVAIAAGRYSDPLRTSMMRFAGNLSGTVSADEIFLGGSWYTYRLQGSRTLGPTIEFAPELENEVEDELAVTWSARPTGDLGVTAQLFYRRDRNVIEDYDPFVYFDPAAAGALALDPATFGYAPGDTSGVSYFLGNLVGAERETLGADVELRRVSSGRWSGSLQYSWRDAEGNSNSDGAADLQGDFLELDPRQPYMWGDLPGTVPHQLKVYGSYQLPWNLELGGLFYWSSGSVFTEADVFRPTSHGIYYNHRRSDGSYVRTGTERQPSWHTLDLRLRYLHELPLELRAEVFLDVFNALDDQSVYLVEEGHNDPSFLYREPRAVIEPRRYQVGFRLSF